MKHIVDIENWERKDNFSVFQGFVSCWFSMTCHVDCTDGYRHAKASGRSFFLYYLYSILRAANEIQEFRFRIDQEGRVVYYDNVDVLTPIAVPGRTFFTIRVKYYEDFDKFYTEAHKQITTIPADGDPYGADRMVGEQGDYDVILLSATPKLYFTSIGYTLMESGRALNYPLMNAGKAIMRDGRMEMPISMSVSHQFVDGAHIQRFMEKVEYYMNVVIK